MLVKCVVIGYLIVNLALLLGLSIYDYKNIMLSKKLFYSYIPVSVLSIVPNLLLNKFNIGYVLLTSVVSALVLYGMFFLIALLTKNKLGGGDVKLIPFIGFSFGPYIQSVLIFMAISMVILLVVALIHNLICSCKKIPKEEYMKKRINGPYPAIPFMFIGCIVTSVIEAVKICTM